MASRLDIDNYNYHQALLAFESTSNDGELVTTAIQQLFKALMQEAIVFQGQQSLKIAEIACGAGHRTVEYFRNVQFMPGLDIRGADLNVQYTGQNGYTFDSSKDKHATVSGRLHADDQGNQIGLTARTFLQAMDSQIIPLKSFSIQRGNAFTGNLLSLLSRDINNQLSEKNSFPVVLMCHCLYYIMYEKEPEKVFQKCLNNVITDILAADGVAIFCHSALIANTHIALEFKYTYQSIKDIQPTPQEYQKYSPDSVIKNFCQQQNLPCYSYEFQSRVCYSQAIIDQQDIIRDINRYDELSDDAVDDIGRLSFIARHRSLKELYLDKTELGLNNFLDEVLSIVKVNGTIPETTVLQVVLSPNASSQMRQGVESAMQQLKEIMSNHPLD